MIKKILYFENPAYLSIRNYQVIFRFPEIKINDTVCDSLKNGIGTYYFH